MLSGYTSATDTLALPLSLAIGVSYRPLYLPGSGSRLICKSQSTITFNYKPGIEVAVYQNYLFVRGGYTFSEQDLEAAINEFKGESNSTYIKSNSSGLSLGIGLNAPVNGSTPSLMRLTCSGSTTPTLPCWLMPCLNFNQDFPD